MKAWKTLLGLGCVSALILGCTVTSGDDDDDDDVDLVDDDVFDDDDDADDGDAGDSVSDDTAMEDDASAGADDTPADDMADAAPAVDFQCDVDADDSCEACMANWCCDARKACAEDPECVEQWAAVRSCADDAELSMSGTPAMDLENCRAEAAGGNSIDLNANADELMFCVNMAVMFGDAGPPPDSGRLEGDGTCTQACWGVFTLEPI